MKFRSSLILKKDFLLLITAKLISLLGTNIQNFALSLYVLKLTGSATKFASVLGITIIPQLLLFPFAGVVVDWFNRKKIIVYLDFLSGITVGTYALIYKINGGFNMWHIYSLVVISTIISVFFGPAINTIIPSIVKKEELVEANSLNSFIMNIGNFASPLIAGILISFFDIYVILVLNAVSFIGAAIQETFINVPKNNKTPEKINLRVFLKDFSEGIQFIKNKAILFNIALIALVVNFIFSPILSIGITYISKQILKVSDYQYGIIESSTVVAMIFAPIIGSVICKKIDFRRIFFSFILFTSFLGMLMALVSSPSFINLFSSMMVPYVTFIFIICLIALVVSVGNMSIEVVYQEIIPLNIMGRVRTTLNCTSMAAMPLSYMIYGRLFDKMPVWICITVSCILLFIVIVAFRNKIYNINSEDAEKEEMFFNKDNEIEFESNSFVTETPETACLFDVAKENLNLGEE